MTSHPTDQEPSLAPWPCRYEVLGSALNEGLTELGILDQTLDRLAPPVGDDPDT